MGGWIDMSGRMDEEMHYMLFEEWGEDEWRDGWINGWMDGGMD